MIHLIPVIGPYWEKLPHMIIDASIHTFGEGRSLWSSVFVKLPPKIQDQILVLESQFDVIIAAIMLVTLIAMLGSRSTRSTYAGAGVSLMCWVLGCGFMFFLCNLTAKHQFAHYAASFPDPADIDLKGFVSQLPLDLQVGLTEDQIHQFMETAGSSGRAAYALYLCANVLVVSAYTYLHRQLFSITKTKSEHGMFYYLYQRLAVLLCVINLYEIMCLQIVIYKWSQMVLEKSLFDITPQFVWRIATATSLKFGVAYALIGIQLGGLIRFAVSGPSPTEIQPKENTARKRNISKTKKNSHYHIQSAHSPKNKAKK